MKCIMYCAVLHRVQYPNAHANGIKKKKGFRCSASSSAFAELHCPCPCHPRCRPNNGCEVLNDSCGQEAIASTQSQSVSQSPTTSQICHLHFLDFSPCPREPLDLMTFFFLITNITKLRSGELSSASRPYGKSPNVNQQTCFPKLHRSNA